MDFSALMKIASENRVSAAKQQFKQKVDTSKTNSTTDYKLSREAVKAFLAKQEEEKKRHKAEEDAARKARILARLESEKNAKSAKISSSVSSRKLSAQKSGKPQAVAQSSKAKHSPELTVGKIEKRGSQTPHTSLKTKVEKHRKSVSKLSEDIRTDNHKKEIKTPKKQSLVNKTPKGAPVNFKDLLRIAEAKAKDPNTKIVAENITKATFQIKQKQNRKGDKPFATSKSETTNSNETVKKKRKNEQSSSLTGPQTEAKTQPPKNVKCFMSSRNSKTAKSNDFVSGSKNGSTTSSVQGARAPKGGSIEAQLGLSFTNMKVLPEAKARKYQRASEINDQALHTREKCTENTNFVRRGEQRASGIEAQFGSVKETSHERKRKHERENYIRNGKFVDGKAVQRDLQRASGIEAQIGSIKRRKQEEDYHNYDECDEADEFDDFIDDSGDEVDVSRHIRDIFGYDRTRYRDSDDDVRNMESSFSQIEKEEVKSLQIARLEDEVEFLKEQAMLKKQKEELKKSLKRK